MNINNKLKRRLEAEKIYYEQFWNEKHSWLRKWLIVKLIEIQLICKK